MKTAQPGIWLAILGTLLLAAVGCADREHMNDDYGKRNRMFFAKQHVSPTAAEGAPTGLDSEEAAVIQSTYQSGLGKDGEAGEKGSSQVLVLEPNRGDAKK